MPQPPERLFIFGIIMIDLETKGGGQRAGRMHRPLARALLCGVRRKN